MTLKLKYKQGLFGHQAVIGEARGSVCLSEDFVKNQSVLCYRPKLSISLMGLNKVFPVLKKKKESKCELTNQVE